jgi:23S rRNA pseudouridine2605 synthase
MTTAKTTAKTKKVSKTKKAASLKPEVTEPKLVATPETKAEAKFEAEVEAAAVNELEGEEAAEASENEAEAEDSPEPEDDSEPEFIPQPRPPAKLERLQKILAAAGVASRRSAEGMIEQGRVQVNGKIVTELGTKADAGRDHIRVDGKLLQGAERLRYFILNKPRGFVTTVKDPEGRPTVMQFFDKMKERLYPVGRLDYMSEGLLLVTNDGELANRLTKASSGVEKTYLVKVAGQPSEAELDILRGGVSIERGKPGSGQVRTSPARIRQVRQGDNPWYEVVLIEGRNRELRKMFEEVGHFVEKIRRVGYGPLVLDQEPGNLRELEPEELAALRLAAEGKLRTPKSKDLRRRNLLDAGLLPTVLPKPSSRPRTALPLAQPPATADRPSDFKSKKFGQDQPARPTDRFASGAANKLFRPAAGRSSDRAPARADDRPRRSSGTNSVGPAKFGSARPSSRPAARPTRPSARFSAAPTGEARPARPAFDRPGSAATGRTGPARPFTAKPAWKKPERQKKSARSERTARPERPARPDFKRQAPPRREARVFDEDLGPVRPPNLQIEEITGPDRSSAPRPYADRPASDRPRPSRPSFDRPASSSRPSSFRPRPDRPTGDRPSRPSFARPESGLARPFTTSSGKPRPGGARPSSKPGRFAKPGSTTRSSSGPRQSSSSRPFKPRTEGVSDYRPTKAKPYPSSTSRAERKAGPGWRPKPSGTRSKPKPGAPADRSSSVGWKPGSSAKPSHRVKPGGKSSGKKRNY